MLTHQEKLDALLAEFGRQAHMRLERALSSEAVPASWMTDEKSDLLEKAVVDTVCRIRPFRPVNSFRRDEFDALFEVIE